MSTPLAQYLVSDDPTVVEAVRNNEAATETLIDRSRSWAEERGATLISFNMARTQVVGLASQPQGFGQWTQPRYGTSRPYKTNAAERAALTALSVDHVPVPGLPRLVDSVRDGNGSFYWMTPRPFVHEGRAWVGLSHAPDPKRDDRQMFGPEWRECLSSEFAAADDAASEALRTDRQRRTAEATP